MFFCYHCGYLHPDFSLKICPLASGRAKRKCFALSIKNVKLLTKVVLMAPVNELNEEFKLSTSIHDLKNISNICELCASNSSVDEDSSLLQ